MSGKKRGLGRGLSALIGDGPVLDPTSGDQDESRKNHIKNIPLEKIRAKKDQPRKEFDKESLEELARSIEVHGVIQPILLRKIGDRYEIIAGERRYRASKLTNLQEIPAIISKVDNKDAAKLSLIENIQREDLNPIEEAMAYNQLIEEFNLTQNQLAKAIGKSRSYITNSTRLLNLDKKVIEYLYNGKLTIGHGKVLLGVKDKRKQRKIANKVIELGLNVRDTEKEIKKKTTRPKPKPKKTSNKDPYILDIEDQLMRSLGTKVNLIKGKKSNKIEIEYYSDEDLSRIFDILTN